MSVYNQFADKPFPEVKAHFYFSFNLSENF